MALVNCGTIAFTSVVLEWNIAQLIISRFFCFRMFGNSSFPHYFFRSKNNIQSFINSPILERESERKSTREMSKIYELSDFIFFELRRWYSKHSNVTIKVRSCFSGINLKTLLPSSLKSPFLSARDLSIP